MTAPVYLTQEGLDKLTEELNQLKTVERPDISKQIAEARDKGDLSENAEYTAAKEAQGLLELKISKMEEQLANARVISDAELDHSHVRILCNVKIKNLSNGKTMSYTIVPENEANIREGKLSVGSPIAKGLLGKEVGDEAEIQVPSGRVAFQILEINW